MIFDLVAFNVSWGLFGVLFIIHDLVLIAVTVVIDIKSVVMAHGPFVLFSPDACT